MEEPILLDIGCGMNKYNKSWVGMDKSPDVDADIVWDAREIPWPFEDESVHQLRTSHFLEHLSASELIPFMNECWRVLKWSHLPKINGLDPGKMWHLVPHADCMSAKHDPTHKNFFVETNMKFFCGEYIAKYSLDYGIDCIFYEYHPPAIIVPEGRDPKYSTLIQFRLLKSLKHYDGWKDKFPFNKPKKARAETCNFVPRCEDPAWWKDESWKTKHNAAFSDKAKRIAKRAINAELEKIIKIKVDATRRYGDQAAPLGLKGLFADINRKHRRAERYMWDGIRDTSENIEDTLSDMAVYCILALMEIDERKIHGKDS